MICNYYYFSDGFKYQQYVCNECCDFRMTVMNLSDFCILNIGGIDYKAYISGINKKDAVIVLNNSKLTNEGVL